MQEFGMRMPWLILDQGQYYRLVTSLYITHGFYMLAINTFGQLVVGFALEKVLGSPWRMTIFYFLTGLFANTVGVVLTDHSAAGPEPVVFGKLAGLTAALVYYW